MRTFLNPGFSDMHHHKHLVSIFFFFWRQDFSVLLWLWSLSSNSCRPGWPQTTIEICLPGLKASCTTNAWPLVSTFKIQSLMYKKIVYLHMSSTCVKPIFLLLKHIDCDVYNFPWKKLFCFYHILIF